MMAIHSSNISILNSIAYMADQDPIRRLYHCAGKKITHNPRNNIRMKAKRSKVKHNKRKGR